MSEPERRDGGNVREGQFSDVIGAPAPRRQAGISLADSWNDPAGGDAVGVVSDYRVELAVARDRGWA
jgi:hypothetical protein